MRALILATCLAGPVFASDGVKVSGLLSDAEFLRLLTCGAGPDELCQMDPVKWATPGQLSLSFGPVPQGYPVEKVQRIDAAIDRAIAEINGVGAAVRLQRVAHTNAAQIKLRPTLFRENEAISGEPGVADGERIGVGYVFVNWDDTLALTQSTILIAQDIYTPEIDSVVLEEITQSLGFLFDIENPDYEGKSIFAQSTNTVLTLTGQDAAVLRLFYPD